jgi:hypothetical protein
MNIEFFSKVPLIALTLLWLAYALLGWYLAANHIVWLVGIFVAVVALGIVSRSISWLNFLISLGSRTLVVILALSTSIALVATWSILFSLFLLPLTTTILANLDMRFAGFSKTYTFLTLTILAGLGLLIGEFVDIVFFPSIRY